MPLPGCEQLIIAVLVPPQLDSASALELSVLSTTTLARIANPILLAAEPLLKMDDSLLVAIHEPQIEDANPVAYDKTPHSRPLPKWNTKSPVVYVALVYGMGAVVRGHECLFLTLLLVLIMVIQLGGGV